MRRLWSRAGVAGSVSVSMAFGSMLWWQKKPTEPLPTTDTDTGSPPAGAPGPGTPCPASPYELKLVQVLFRHGARTPLKSIPDVLEAQWIPDLLDPPAHTQINYTVTDLEGGPRPPAPLEDGYRKNVLSGGTFAGQLTSVGMQQLYELGQRLRRSYVQDTPFLCASFSPTEVYVRSTNIVRTIESAKCLIAGLFQQQQSDTVSIVTTSSEAEILYPNYHGCKLLSLLGGPRWVESSTLPDIAADLQSLQSALGVAKHHPLDFIHIRDDMVARETHGLPCPPVLDAWREKVEQRAVDMMFHIYDPSQRENLQLCVGPLLHTLMGNMDNTLQDPEPSRKLFLYSTHDTTLMPCLMALGVFDQRWPPYAADITVELLQHRQTREPVVKVSYLGQDQLIQGCSGVFCPLEEFRQALSAYALTSDLYQTLCNRTESLTPP